MNKKTLRNILIILLVILLLVVIIYFLFFFNRPSAVKTKNATTTSQTGKTSTLPVTAVKNPNAQPATPVEITGNNLVKIADSFAERLGSYSNQSNFSNITDLKIMMTPSMQAWADKYIAANQSGTYTPGYQGVTTQAIAAETFNFDNTAGTATILVHTQKVSVTGTSTPATTYQDITITFVKKGNSWLVDNAVWKK